MQDKTYINHIKTMVSRMATAGEPTDAEVMRVCGHPETTLEQLTIAVELTTPLESPWRQLVGNLRRTGLASANVPDTPNVMVSASVSTLLALIRQ